MFDQAPALPLTSAGNANIAAEIVKTYGTDKQELEAQKAEWDKSKRRHTSDNSDFNTAVVAEDLDEIVAHASAITGRDAAELRNAVDTWVIEEDDLRLAADISTSVAGGVNDTKLTDDLYGLANSASEHDDPYAQLESADKLKLMWHFINRTISEQADAAKVAGKFTLTDADLDELASLDDDTRAELAVLAMRMKITSLTDVKHMWATKVDRSLTHAVQRLTERHTEEVSDEDIAAFNELSNGPDLLPAPADLEAKLRLLNGALAHVSAPDTAVRRAAFSTIAGFAAEDADTDYITENKAQVVGTSAVMVGVPTETFDSTFSAGDLLAVEGGVLALLLECLSVESIPAALVPVSERVRLTDELMYLLAVAYSVSGLLPQLSTDLAEAFNKADKRREHNNKESLYDQLVRLKDEYEGNDSDEDDELSADEVADFFSSFTDAEDEDAAIAAAAETLVADDDADADTYGYFGEAAGVPYDDEEEDHNEDQQV